MSEVEDLRKRVTELAKEKSKLQMVTDILTELAGARGLSEVVQISINTIMNAWGGSNVILYYELDDQWYRSDVYEESVKSESIDDPKVDMVLSTGTFFEYVQDEESMVFSELSSFSGRQGTWIYPLKTGDTIFGAIKMEGVFFDYTEGIKEILMVIINYISLILRSEILTAGRLVSANNALKSEIAIRIEEEKRYRNIIDSSFDGFWLVDPRGRFIEVNDIYCQMFGYTQEELLTMSISDIETSENDAEITEHIKNIKETGKDRFESLHRCKDGTLIDVEVNTIFTDFKGGMFYAFIRDIRVSKEGEKERLRLEEQYFQTQKVESIGRLAGGVAHDLNNLLTPILGYSELLIGEFNTEDSRKKKVSHILQAGLRARDLVQQLLAFSRKQALEYQVINLNYVIQNFQNLLRRTIREDIEFHLNLYPDLVNIKADVGQIEQVLMNLSVNAQDAMPEGGLLLIQTELVELENEFDNSLQKLAPGKYAVLTISDTGTGMDQETKNLIFEPFFSTKGEQGTGLGLATVFGIVSQHGGGIQTLSEPGKGCRFKIYMPVIPVSEVQKNRSVDPGQPQAVSATILLVEDNDQVRNLAYEILSQREYKIHTAANGIEALSILKDEKSNIDLLLTDVIMPGMNGRELSDQALKILPDLKVIFMSGYTDDIILIHDLNKEGLSLLQKPFTMNSLTSKVYETLMR